MFQPDVGWSGIMAKPDQRRAHFAEVRSFVGEVYGGDLHAKRIDSLAGATLGVMQSASLAVAIIGQALALAKGLVERTRNPGGLFHPEGMRQLLPPRWLFPVTVKVL
jgi:hypothetical protein